MPFTVCVNTNTLLDELKKLFDGTGAFGDARLLGANRCILAAACRQSGDLTGQAHELKMASPEVAQSLIDLLHCRKVTLSNGADQFFDLFKLAKRMDILSCKELCQSVVESGDYNRESVELALSSCQADSIRKQLHQWRTPQPQWTDVAVRLRGEEAVRTRAHLVLLAGHCEYFRALWAGNFREDMATPDIIVEDEAELEIVEMLLQAIYGNAVETASEEKLVRLCCLADKWQCGSVCSATLLAMEAQNALVATVAIDILGWGFPAPEVLVQAATRAIRSSQTEGDLTVQNMPMLAACRLLKHLELDSDDVLLKGAVNVRVMSGLASEDVPKMALKQISSTTLPDILKSCPLDKVTRKLLEKLPSNLACWAQELQTLNTAAAEDDACHHVAKLAWAGAPSTIVDALREAIVQIFARKEDISNGFISDVMQAVVANKGASDTEPMRKKRKTILLGLEPCMKDVLREAAVDWVAQNLFEFLRCSDWKNLEPDVLVSLVDALWKRKEETARKEKDEMEPFAIGARVFRKGKLATVLALDATLDPPSYTVRMCDGTEVNTEPHLLQLIDEAAELRTGIREWLGEVSVSAATTALQLAANTMTSNEATGNVTLFQILLDGIRSRWEAAETQNVVLQGGRHKEDIAAANRQTELKLRDEYEDSMATLRASLDEEHRNKMRQVAVAHQEAIADMQKRVNVAVNAVFAEVAQSGGCTGECV